MCDCAGNSRPQKLNLPVNKKNVDGLKINNKNTVVDNKNKNKNTAVNNKNTASSVPTEKTSKTAAFIASLFAKFL